MVPVLTIDIGIKINKRKHIDSDNLKNLKKRIVSKKTNEY